jgi:polysaccharide biosynthesis protein PslH
VKQRIKKWWFGLLGKDPEAVVVSFCSGDEKLSRAMCDEIRSLIPDRRHFEIRADEDPAEVRRRLRPYRIGLAPVLFDGERRFRRMRRLAFLLAPRRILAYNARLERHHLRFSLASLLFLRGVPLDRIFLRPWPWKKDKTIRPAGHRVIEGRAANARRRTIAILTPYLPYPLSHGGAVRIFNLIREAAREFNVIVYAFTEGPVDDFGPLLEFVTHIYLVAKPRYREPRWSSLAPPEVNEYDSPEMRSLIARREADLLQVEYTYLARYGGDILVEHDVTFDLQAQVHARSRTVSSWWNWSRWRRFEWGVTRSFREIVVMSEKDQALLGRGRVIENGVDLSRFEPAPEASGRRLLFIGSFRHFPNIVAFRFLVEQIFPLAPDAELTVVAGPDSWLHWRIQTGTLPPELPSRIRVHEFVADVRPLYRDTNVVVVPTLESAGTNLKVLEALATQRAVVSTTSGCAGLGLVHRENIWIADSPVDFAAAIVGLFSDDPMRARIAAAGRACVESRFDWRSIGWRQRELYCELLADPITIRAASGGDNLKWDPSNCRVALSKGAVAGFLASRQTAPGEREILDIAVDTEYRRRGIARRLLDEELSTHRGAWFLEVRESNSGAIALYESLGFHRFAVRPDYYSDPSESAIVMRFIS